MRHFSDQGSLAFTSELQIAEGLCKKVAMALPALVSSAMCLPEFTTCVRRIRLNDVET